MTKSEAIKVLYDLSEHSLRILDKGSKEVDYVDMKYVEKYINLINIQSTLEDKKQCEVL